ncbi:MAG: hypothetical protein R3190_16665 [Thermoanaerobaculia bacterium]|nr:hypothetical protein [Thermoanaerobaculia bacterium]
MLPFRIGSLLAALIAAPVAAQLAVRAAPPPATETQVVDRIVAVVDEDPILASDLERLIGLGLVERQAGETEDELRRRVLDLAIEERLRFHEIDRYGFAEVPVDEVEAQFAGLERRLGGPAALRQRLAEAELDEQGLRQLLARQLMVLIYVEERLGPRVLIGEEEISNYYHEVLAPEMVVRKQAIPPIGEVREQIRAVLREQRLDEEIDLWTEELRLEADIEDYLGSSHDGLPPVVVDRTEVGDEGQR